MIPRPALAPRVSLGTCPKLLPYSGSALRAESPCRADATESRATVKRNQFRTLSAHRPRVSFRRHAVCPRLPFAAAAPLWLHELSRDKVCSGQPSRKSAAWRLRSTTAAARRSRFLSIRNRGTRTRDLHRTAVARTNCSELASKDLPVSISEESKTPPAPSPVAACFVFETSLPIPFGRSTVPDRIMFPIEASATASVLPRAASAR